MEFDMSNTFVEYLQDPGIGDFPPLLHGVLRGTVVSGGFLHSKSLMSGGLPCPLTVSFKIFSLDI
jgi:hypothetical protein